MGLPELLIVLLLIAFPIWGIVDAAKRPDSVWTEADQNKIVWVLLQLFLWSVGTAIYIFAVRPKLERAEERT